MLEASCSHFIKSGLTDRIAKHFLRDIPRAKGLKPDMRCAHARVPVVCEGGDGTGGRVGTWNWLLSAHSVGWLLLYS